MNLKEFIDKRANKSNPIGDLCGDILRVDKKKGYDWSRNDKEVLSAIEFGVAMGPGGQTVMSAFKSFKKAFEKQMMDTY